MKTKGKRIASLLLLISLLLTSFTSVFALEKEEGPGPFASQEAGLKGDLATPFSKSENRVNAFVKEARKEMEPSKAQEGKDLDKKDKEDTEKNKQVEEKLKEKLQEEKLKEILQEEKLVGRIDEEVDQTVDRVIPKEEGNEEQASPSLTREDRDRIKEYKDRFKGSSFNEPDPVDLEAFIKEIQVVKAGEEVLDPKVALRPLDGNKAYLELTLSYKEAKNLRKLQFNLSKNAYLMKEVYSHQDLIRMEEILKEIDSKLEEKPRLEKPLMPTKKRGLFDHLVYPKAWSSKNFFENKAFDQDPDLQIKKKDLSQGLSRKDTIDLKEKVKELTRIQPIYRLEDQGLRLVKEEETRDLACKEFSLASSKAFTKEIKLVFRLKGNALEDMDFLSMTLGEGPGADQISLVKKMMSRSVGLRSQSNTSPVQGLKTIHGEDIAPANYLKLVENMPGARARVTAGPGVHTSQGQEDIVHLAAGTANADGALWAGDWERSASKLVFDKLAGTDATAVRFKPSKPGYDWYWNYRLDMDAGWNKADLDLSTTSMYVRVDYKNAAYYKNDIVDAKATIKVTPMKNRTPGSYESADYGNFNYYPMIQISHNLYKGWCWQNVREINIDLAFYKKDGTKIQFDSATFASDKASYYTINSLNPKGEYNHGSSHNIGPEFVRPSPATFTGAYVIPGSNIVTSYGEDQKVGVQYAYNGGNNPWTDDSPEKPGWSKNSVLFTTSTTDHLNFTMGNLMRDPGDGFVPRTNFVWTSMSTQSFTNHYVNYKDIEVEKTWSDGGRGQEPIRVRLCKTYKVKLSYSQAWWGKETREIEVKDLLDQEITLSETDGWKGGFYQVPDESAQKKLLMRAYKRDKKQLKEDAGENFPSEIPGNFTIDSVDDFSYSISEVAVEGYESKVDKTTYPDKDRYTITNTKKGENPASPQPLKPRVSISKTIDYLGDGGKNPDTGIQEDLAYKDKLPDIYRLYLDVVGQRVKKDEATDLLFVLDGSSSMLNRDMKNTWGHPVSRKQAMEDMLNTTDLIPSFLGQNKNNRVAFVYFNGSTRNKQTKKNQGYSYTMDGHIIRGWSHDFTSIQISIPGRHFGTNYQAGLLQAENLLKESIGSKRRQAVIFISDGVPTYYINKQGDRIGNGRYNDKTTVKNSMDGTKRYFNEFTSRFPNVTVHAVGVSKDIYETSSGSSQSPEVLQYMARQGSGDFISVKDDTKELVEKLRHAIEEVVSQVSIEDTLSDHVDLVAGGEDLKMVKKNTLTGEVRTLYEKNHFTPANENQRIIQTIRYNPNEKKYLFRFHPSYKLEENTRYIVSYNVQTSNRANKDFKLGGYPAKGDKNTDYPGNRTSSGRSGFPSNKEAKLNYNGTSKTYPHPVVQVRDKAGFELPPTGGSGILVFKSIGVFLILARAYFLRK